MLEDAYKYNKLTFSRNLYSNISKEIKQRLELFNSMESDNQLNYIENIASNLYEFRNILNIVEKYDTDQEFINSEIEVYLNLRKELAK